MSTRRRQPRNMPDIVVVPRKTAADMPEVMARFGRSPSVSKKIVPAPVQGAVSPTRHRKPPLAAQPPPSEMLLRFMGLRASDGSERVEEMRKHLRKIDGYGLTLDQWDALVLRAEGRCEICSRPLESPNIDHCHKTGRVRGLLCHQCNVGIGQLGDTAEDVWAAYQYLTLPPTSLGEVVTLRTPHLYPTLCGENTDALLPLPPKRTRARHTSERTS